MNAPADDLERCKNAIRALKPRYKDSWHPSFAVAEGIQQAFDAINALERAAPPADDVELPEEPKRYDFFVNPKLPMVQQKLASGGNGAWIRSESYDALRSLARKLKERVEDLNLRLVMGKHIADNVWKDRAVEAERKLAEAEQRAGRDGEDAERYRWLVSQAFWRGTHCIQLFGEFADHQGRGVASQEIKKECMDAAIDAARRERKG